MKTKVYVALLLVVTLLLSLGFTRVVTKGQKQMASEDDITIVTSFYPMYIATCNIVGDLEDVSVVNMSEPQAGCLHDFQMTPDDMRLLSVADVFVANGGGIESFLGDVEEQYDNLTIVTATKDLPLLEEDENVEAEAGSRSNGSEKKESKHGKDADGNGKVESGDHDHEGANAHAWVSISLYRQMVANITSGLAEADPSHADTYYQNAAVYDEKLAELQETQQQMTMKYAGQNVILFHEAYEYLAKDLGMNVVYTLDLDEERQISAGELAETIKAIKKSHVKVIFAEETYGEKIGKLIEKECDVKVLYLNPLTKRNDNFSDGEDEFDFYFLEQYNNLAQIRDTYEAIEQAEIEKARAEAEAAAEAEGETEN